jgi:NADH-quinone oxidoreductase subunit E
MSLSADARERLEIDAKEIIGRYPQSRSALLPLLHLVQAEEGFVSADGIELCAELLEITTAEVAAVATFYTMYRRRPGGDQIFATLKSHLGVGHDETTEDGRVTLEHLECNAACDYAPVVMVNWEFFDDQTPESATQLVDDLRAGRAVRPTRGPHRVCTFTDVSRVLAGFPDGLAHEGPAAGPKTLVGLQLYREQSAGGESGEGGGGGRPRTTSPASPRTSAGGAAATAPSAHDAPAETAASDPDSDPAKPGGDTARKDGDT